MAAGPRLVRQAYRRADGGPLISCRFPIYGRARGQKRWQGRGSVRAGAKNWDSISDRLAGPAPLRFPKAYSATLCEKVCGSLRRSFLSCRGAFCAGLTQCVLSPFELELAALGTPAVIVGLREPSTLLLRSGSSRSAAVKSVPNGASHRVPARIRHLPR
jgi:hypothetical protein